MTIGAGTPVLSAETHQEALDMFRYIHIIFILMAGASVSACNAVVSKGQVTGSSSLTSEGDTEFSVGFVLDLKNAEAGVAEEETSQ